MRIPWATLLLTAAVLAVYAFSSGGQLYPDSGAVAQGAFGFSNPFGLLFHLFFHIGARHLVGNLLPLVAFAMVLEITLSGRHMLSVFFVSGVLAALLFSLLNPSSFLAGASAGVAGLMGAAALARPKWAVVLLVAVPVLSSFVALPFLAAFTQASFEELGDQSAALSQEAGALAAQGQAERAAAVQAQADTLADALLQQAGAQAAEEKAVPDFFVHLAGALIGAAYVLLFLSSRVHDGFDELAPLVEGLLGRRAKQ
ncbi:MAG: rhomboid family intramembrane serine protease [Candidatus Micrarchaeota archaeon]|nr:rhomboid family intramembrane serine protease [Candidatus Micrarchaeota archaeon]